MDRIEKREAAIRRVEAAARELGDAQLELAELTESAEELTALVLYGEDRPATLPHKPPSDALRCLTASASVSSEGSQAK